MSLQPEYSRFSLYSPFYDCFVRPGNKYLSQRFLSTNPNSVPLSRALFSRTSLRLPTSYVKVRHFPVEDQSHPPPVRQVGDGRVFLLHDFHSERRTTTSSMTRLRLSRRPHHLYRVRPGREVKRETPVTSPSVSRGTLRLSSGVCTLTRSGSRSSFANLVDQGSPPGSFPRHLSRLSWSGSRALSSLC